MHTSPLRPTDRLAIAITFAMVLISCTLSPLTQDKSYLGISWFLIVFMGAASMIIRRTRMGAAGAGAAQLILIGLLTVWIAGVVSPAGESVVHRIPALYGEAFDAIRSTAAPMASNEGHKLLFASSLGGIMLLIDQLVITMGRPAWSLAGLLAVFGVPAITLGNTGAWAFGCVAISYLAILLADGLNRARSWAHGLSSDPAQDFHASAPAETPMTAVMVWRGATYLAVPAIVLTLVASAAVPVFPVHTDWGKGNGGNGGSQHGPIKMGDPTLNLRRNLTRPKDRQVLSYRTNKSSGSYLRMASLPRLSSHGWKNSKTRIDRGKRLPKVPGLTATHGRERHTSIQIKDLDSQYLPLPFAPRRFSTHGSWGFDPRSLVVLSARHGHSAKRATHDLTYSVVSRDIEPTADDLSTAGAGTPPDADKTTKVPGGLPAKVKRLTERVTRDASNAADKAAAIQDYLRDSGRYTYDLDKRPGSGYTAVQNFLFKDHRGYCEQFAGTMSVMARVAGIPSRVAVGFLPGAKHGKDWIVTSNNMHAWPELYFSGYGWIRYEPTPSEVTGEAPAWTVPADDSDDESDSNAGADSEGGDASSSAAPSAPQQQRSQTATRSAEPVAPSARPPIKRIVSTGGGVLVLLAVLAAPGMLRAARRRRRLNGAFPEPGDQVEAGWSEIRDTARDLGHRWPNGSPRAIAVSVRDWLPDHHTTGDPDPPDTNSPAHDSYDQGGDNARTALTRLAVLVERGRYAAAFTDTAAAAEVAHLVAQIRAGMFADRSAVAKVRVTVLPRSLLHRR